jgi:DNA-directed RNA polymerase subunit E'/Rpb7
METIPIFTDIIIFPHMLSNVMENIHSEIVKRYLNRWTEEYGYIMAIDKNFTILSNVIQRDNMRISFRVKAMITRVLPREGLIIKAKITKIIPMGIFLSYETYMHILITKTSFEGTYNKDDETFTINNNLIKKDMEVNVEITKCMWAKDKFSVIGKFADY